MQLKFFLLSLTAAVALGACTPSSNPVFPEVGYSACASGILVVLDESAAVDVNTVRASLSTFWVALSLSGYPRMSLVEFSATASVVRSPEILDSLHAQELLQHINSAEYTPSGTANWGEALRVANDEFLGPRSPSLVIFITGSSGTVGDACEQANRLKARGIKVFHVSVGASGTVLGSTAWDENAASFSNADYVSTTSLGSTMETLSATLCPLESCSCKTADGDITEDVPRYICLQAAGAECLPVASSCLGDLTNDGEVAVGDLAILIQRWGTCSPP